MSQARRQARDDPAPAPRRCRDMAELRAEIDRLDRAVVALLAERTAYVRQAAELKTRQSDIVDRERIAEVLAKVAAEARARDLPAELTEPVYRVLIERSIALETAAFARKAAPGSG